MGLNKTEINYCIKRTFSVIGFFLIIINSAFSQTFHFGLPIQEYYDFPISDFKSVTHDAENRLYISANEKLLRFKGYYDVLLDDKDIDCLYFGDSLLYYGGSSEYGILKWNEQKEYNLSSIFKQADDKVTHIANSNYGNFILAKNTVFHFQDNVAKKYSFPGIVDFLGNVNNSTILHDDTNGLSIFVGGRFKIVNKSSFLSTMQVIEIRSVGSGDYIVATKNNGLYRYDGESFSEFGGSYLNNKRILDIEVIQAENSPSEIIVITDKNELISLNFSGSLVHDKLYTNKLLALHRDNDNKLYVISEEGIMVFFYNLPFQIIDMSQDAIHGPVSIFNNQFYWGTNNGLFYSHIMEQRNLLDARVRLTDTEGKVGKLDIVNNTFLMSHEDGLYDILPKIGARFIPDEKFFDFEEIEEDYLLAFSDRRSYLLKKLRGRWRVVEEIVDFPIHPKSVVYDKSGFLWLVDRDYNLLQYKYDIKNESFDLIQTKRNPDKVALYDLENEVVQIRENKAYRFNYINNEFEISEELTAIFGSNLNIEQLTEDPYGNIWYIQDGDVGIFRATSNENRISFKRLEIDFPYSDARRIYPYDKNNVFINNGDHVLKLDLEKYEKMQVVPPHIDRIVAINSEGKRRSIFSYDLAGKDILDKVVISPTDKLEVYTSDELFPQSTIEYALSNSKDTPPWQVSDRSSSIDFKDLKIDDYKIQLRRNMYDGISSQITIPLEVKRPFWESRGQYIFLGLFGLLITMMGFFIGRFYERRKNRKIKYATNIAEYDVY